MFLSRCLTGDCNSLVYRIVLVCALVLLNVSHVSANCGTTQCDVGQTFLYDTYCCGNAGDQCCKTFRWEPITIVILIIIGALVVIGVLCCCFCTCCKCLYNMFCCCCKKDKRQEEGAKMERVHVYGRK